jgi:ABC-2 type transport system ATP-binding protein
VALLIEAREVGYSYETHRVLNDVSFALDRGLHFLLGVNGAGKTTLIRILLGALRPRTGQIVLVGQPNRNSNNGGQPLDVIGYLPQRFGAPTHMRVEQFVAYVAWLRGMPRKQIRDSVARALTSVDMQEHARTRLGELSGGMLRRVGVAQAVVHNPGILLLDEPTDGLDPRQRVRIRELLASLSDHMCVLVSTHLLEDIRQTAGNVLILDGGRIVFQGTDADLQGQTGQSSLEAAFLRLTGS